MRAALHPLSCLVAASIATGCLELRPPPAPARDATTASDAIEPPPRVLGIEALDARGDAWPDDAIPRSPIIRVRASAPLDATAVHLFSGVADADLRDDLEEPPLRAVTLERTWPDERSVEGAALLLRPALLDPGARLVVVVAPWARDAAGRAIDAPAIAEMIVARDPLAGARAIEAWPPDGASAIGTSLAIAGIRFDGAIEGASDAIWIEDDRGTPVPGIARAARCDEIGWSGEHCAVVIPSRPLAPGTAHALRIGPGLRDATGATLPAFAARFTTAEGPDLAPPALRAPTCAIDEVALEGVGCLLADDAHAELRIAASEPVRVRLELGSRRLLAVAPRGEATIVMPDLGPGATIDATLVAIDPAGNEARTIAPIATTEPLAPVAIEAVRADPHGAEPRQEYVELRNRGAVAIDLEGFALADSLSSEGDRISGSHLLAPGASALVVGADFDPDDRGPGGRDAAIPPGLALIRVDRSLGSAGLSNAGEPLFLRDPAGRRVSAAPAQPPPREGVCLVRVAPDLRTGAIGSFEYDPGGGCTPGRRP